MTEEEIIKYIKNEIFIDRHLKGYEEEIKALEGILKLYENEKKITTTLMKANERLHKRISERTKGAELQEERDKEKAKNEELKKGIKSLMESRKKWRDRYNREKAKKKELKKKLANRVELLDYTICKDYISKDKIREKIEEIGGMNEIADIEREIYNRNEYAIEMLLELLEEE